jgi:hypothetical protein
MYTKLDLVVALKHDTPDRVIEALHVMCRIMESHEKKKLIAALGPWDDVAEAFFGTERGVWMFRGVGSLDHDHRNPRFVRDEHGGWYWLDVSFDIKNYTNEIQRFLLWIEPHVFGEAKRVGWFRYEEEDEESAVMWTGHKFRIVGNSRNRDYDDFGRPV